MFPLRLNRPISRPPAVTLAVLAASVLAWLLVQHGPLSPSGGARAAAVRWGAIPSELGHGPGGGEPPAWLTVLSSLLVSPSFLALLACSWFTVIFGPNVEDALGHLRYAALWIVAGIAGLGAAFVAGPDSTAPLTGSAASTSALVAAGAALWPRSHVVALSLVPLFGGAYELPVAAMVALWVGVEVALGLTGLLDAAGGVAWLAPLVTGLAVGAIAGRPLARGGAAVPPHAPA